MSGVVPASGSAAGQQLGILGVDGNLTGFTSVSGILTHVAVSAGGKSGSTVAEFAVLDPAALVLGWVEAW